MRRLIVVAACALVGASAAQGQLAARATAPAAAHKPVSIRCTIFPANNPWNERVDSLPVASDSDTIVASIGTGTGLHPDFGSGLWDGSPIGIPVTTVPLSTSLSAPSFGYADESDAGPYPIPTNVKIEGGSDRHAILLDPRLCRLYELYALQKTSTGWTAGSGAIWNLRSNALRPAGWTSADAAGLPILPGLARYDDVMHGRVTHALRFTVSRTRNTYVWPARHAASSLSSASLPPMGLRLRLRASYDISGFPPQARIVLQALKTYGMMVADNGSNWFISGAPDSRWDNDDLSTLGQVKGSAFEVVDTSSLVAAARRK